MDNLGTHKPERVQELIEEKGCRLWFLPAYSSNLSPIEEAFSKIKELLKKAVARTRQAFAEEAIAEALSAVTPQDTADGSLIASTEPSSTLMNML